MLNEARAAHQAGLCVIPVKGDGSKAPDVPGGKWGEFQQRRPTDREMRGFRFDRAPGFGIVSGAVSGCVAAVDFDDDTTFHAYLKDAAESGLDGAVARIRTGYEDLTPSGGRRWFVRYPPDAEWADRTFARKPIGINPDTGQPIIKTLIELPTFAIVAPSGPTVHPSGRPYVRQTGGFTSIASVTTEEWDALRELARSFDETPRRQAGLKPLSDKPITGGKPGDDYNARTSWAEVLVGWKPLYTRNEVTYWQRPGKSFGQSGTTNYGGSDLFYPFTSASQFTPEQSYSKFAVYTTLNHGGDWNAAARTLAAAGYGAPRVTSTAVASIAALPQAQEATFEALGVFYRYRLDDIEVIFDQLRESFHRKTGTLSVRVGSRAIAPSDWFPSNLKERRSMANYLRDRSDGRKIAWESILDDLAAQIHASERCGEPAIDLATVDLTDEHNEILTFMGATFRRNDSNQLVGDGDTLKSYFAQAFLLQLQRQGLRVGIVDAEMTKRDYARRWLRLSGNRSSVPYLRMTRPLDEDIERVRLFVADARLDAVLLDSIGGLANGSLQSEEAPKKYQAALRQLGVGDTLTAISLTHIRKNTEPGEKVTAFGSAYWRNFTRKTYIVKKTHEAGDEVTVKLTPDKHNHSGLEPSVSVRFRFDGSSGPVTLAQVDESSAATVVDIQSATSATDRIQALLEASPPLTIAEIAGGTNLTRDAVYKALQRDKKHQSPTFGCVSSSDGIQRWTRSLDNSADAA